jgi:hypothetical protein
MSAKNPNGELPPDILSGEYVTLEVGEFRNAYATMLHVMAGKLPVAQGFEPSSRTLPGLGTLEVEDTLFNRAMHTAADLFTDAAKRQSFRWRVVVVMPIAEDRKYRKFRSDDTGSLHIALLTAVCQVRGSRRTTRKALLAPFDVVFRAALKAVEDWAAANPGLLKRH